MAIPPIRLPAARPRFPCAAAEVVIASSGRLPATESRSRPPSSPPARAGRRARRSSSRASCRRSRSLPRRPGRSRRAAETRSRSRASTIERGSAGSPRGTHRLEFHHQRRALPGWCRCRTRRRVTRSADVFEPPGSSRGRTATGSELARIVHGRDAGHGAVRARERVGRVEGPVGARRLLTRSPRRRGISRRSRSAGRRVFPRRSIRTPPESRRCVVRSPGRHPSVWAGRPPLPGRTAQRINAEPAGTVVVRGQGDEQIALSADQRARSTPSIWRIPARSSAGESLRSASVAPAPSLTPPWLHARR